MEERKASETKPNENPKVSVIMPVYNSLPYLSESIEAVLAQTLTDFELICVDDGSTDDSLAVLRSYAQKDERVRVLTQKNQYAGVARNNGMAASRGDYLVFLDSDDLFEPEMLEKMYRRCTEDGADVCICNTDTFNMKTNSFQRYNPLDKSDFPSAFPFTPQSYADHLFTFARSAAWNKMIRRTLPTEHGIAFEARRIGEDLFFSYVCCALAEKITYEDTILLHLRRGQGTNLDASLSRSPKDFAEALCTLKKRLQDEKIFETFEKSYLSVAVMHCYLSVNALRDREIRMNLLSDLRKKYFPVYAVCGRDKNLYESCLTYAMLQWLLSPISEDPEEKTAAKALFMAKECLHCYGVRKSLHEWYKYIRKTVR